MADTGRWTEPLDSARERWYLGKECECGCGDVREVACMSEASYVPIRKWRWAHYGRGVKGGQRTGAARATLLSVHAGLDGGWGRGCESGARHGGGCGWGGGGARKRRGPSWQRNKRRRSVSSILFPNMAR